MSSDIKIVWVDFGGVLSPAYEVLFDSFEERTGISRVQLEAISYQYGRTHGLAPLAPLELALVTQAEWGGEVERMLLEKWPDSDVKAADFRNFGRVWFEGAEVNHRLEEVLADVSTRFPIELGIVTNNVREWEPYWKAMLGDRLPWAHVIDSCRIGYRKPDPKFFTIAQDAAGVEPENCLLIDDFHGNITEARNQGWKAIHFRTNEQVIEELHRHLS
jgi:putative hydrolase of the HAD superfamily